MIISIKNFFNYLIGKKEKNFNNDDNNINILFYK